MTTAIDLIEQLCEVSRVNPTIKRVVNDTVKKVRRLRDRWVSPDTLRITFKSEEVALDFWEKLNDALAGTGIKPEFSTDKHTPMVHPVGYRRGKKIKRKPPVQMDEPWYELYVKFPTEDI